MYPKMPGITSELKSKTARARNFFYKTRELLPLMSKAEVVSDNLKLLRKKKTDVQVKLGSGYCYNYQI